MRNDSSEERRELDDLALEAEMSAVAQRVVAWFSHGACSTIATKLALDEFGDELTIVTIDTGSESDDNDRYRADVEAWLGVEIQVLRSAKYKDTWQVWSERRFLNGPQGALCTTEMKKKVRHAFQRPDDVHVFGYAADLTEVNRANRSRQSEPELGTMRCPLIEQGITKDQCLHLVEYAGIVLPQQYRDGYQNNNCIGCVKGGMGYWNKVRVDRPDVFWRMAAQEREINHSCIHTEAEGMVFLDELDPDRGNYALERSDGCDLFCPTDLAVPPRKDADK